MSNPAVIGALVGLVIGVADFIVLGYARDMLARRRSAEHTAAGTVLNLVRISQLIFFPVVGWFAGPAIASNMGG
ncbi:MAG TPA: hypothetical protein VGO17_14435 [Aurantimonas sp.]|jgi:hypothetical protein|nr:hypothetical protein [Aurantimonas sp.]